MASIALLAKGARLKRRESGAGVNYTLIGDVHLLDQSTHPAYVKLLDPRRLANELLAVELAERMHLAVPQAFVVKLRRVDHADLFRSLSIEHDEVFGFGTRGLPAEPLAKAFNVADPAFVRWFFVTLKQWKDVAAFDSWIANSDRHTNNLLIDKQLKLWLIDHDLAFGGHADIAGLKHDEVTANRLVNDFGPLVDLRHRHEVVDECHTFQARAGAVDLDDAARASSASLFLSEKDINQLVLYVRQRTALISSILAGALGVPLLT